VGVNVRVRDIVPVPEGDAIGEGVDEAVDVRDGVRDIVPVREGVDEAVDVRDGVRDIVLVGEGVDEAVGVRVEVFAVAGVGVNVKVGLPNPAAEARGAGVLLGVLEERTVSVESGVLVEVTEGVCVRVAVPLGWLVDVVVAVDVVVGGSPDKVNDPEVFHSVPMKMRTS